MKTEAQKRASQKWDTKNLHTASARLSIADYERFKAACDRRGETMHAAIMRYCKYYAKKYGSAAAPPRAKRAGSARLRLRRGAAAPASAPRSASARRRCHSKRPRRIGWLKL